MLYLMSISEELCATNDVQELITSTLLSRGVYSMDYSWDMDIYSSGNVLSMLKLSVE